MKPDEKYMSEVNIKNKFKFIPPSFNRNFIIDDDNEDVSEEKESLDLFPNETSEDQVYCYYNSLGNCKNGVNTMSSVTIEPRTFEALRGFDLDINDTSDSKNNTTDFVNKIYDEILKREPEIDDALSIYGMPSPIKKVITKKIIKLSLLYNNKE